MTQRNILSQTLPVQLVYAANNTMANIESTIARNPIANPIDQANQGANIRIPLEDTHPVTNLPVPLLMPPKLITY